MQIVTVWRVIGGRIVGEIAQMGEMDGCGMGKEERKRHIEPQRLRDAEKTEETRASVSGGAASS